MIHIWLKKRNVDCKTYKFKRYEKVHSFTCTLSIALCNFAQIQSYKIVSQADEERVILPYDSLTNITRNNLPSLIGQKIQILPEMGRSSIGLVG